MNAREMMKLRLVYLLIFGLLVSRSYAQQPVADSLEVHEAYEFGVAADSLDSEPPASPLPDPARPEPGAFDIVVLEKMPEPLNMNELGKRIGYPDSAKKEGIQGKVIVRLLVDEQGRYVRHIVVRKVHPLLDEAVEANIPELRFTPGEAEGKPVKCWITLPFDFKIEN